MPIHVQAPDGSIAEFPDGMSDDQITAVMQTEYGAPKPESQTLGFMQGVDTVARNVGDVVSLPHPHFFGDVESKTRAARDRAVSRLPVQPGRVGEFMGSTAASLPLAFVGGPAAGGALQGYATSNSDSLTGKLVDAGIGAVGGKVGAAIIGKAAGALGRDIMPEARQMAAEGVKLTPGQARGGKALIREDKLMSRPAVGDTVAAGRERSLDTFNRSTLNSVLKPLGVTLPDHVPTGHDAVAFAQQAVSDVYDKVIPTLAVKADKQFGDGLKALTPRVRALPETQNKQLHAILNNMGFDPAGNLSGQALKDAQSEVTRLARAYSTSAVAGEREMGQILSDVRGELDDLIMRHNPSAAPILKRANQAYRGLAVVEDAAGRANDGVFKPNQLKQSALRADRSRRRNGAGTAFMQQQAERATTVMSSKYPDSGTAGRLMASSPMAGVSGLLADAGQKAAQATTDFLLSPGGAFMEPIANGLGLLRRPAGALGSSVVSSRK